MMERKENKAEICQYPAEEIYERAAQDPLMQGFPKPTGAFMKAHNPILCHFRIDGTGSEPRRFYGFLATITGESADLSEELWLDMVLEEAVRRLEESWREETRAVGLLLSPQYAPGRNGIPLRMNRLFGRLGQAEELGVQITEEGLMRPQFTRSGFRVAGNPALITQAAERFRDCCATCPGGSGCSLCAQFVYKIQKSW